IPTDVFFTLYQQGYPIDQLLRLLVESIESTLPTGENVVLINSPTSGMRKTSGSGELSYARFLRACAILREMQLSGLLLMDSKHDKKTVSSTDKNFKMKGQDVFEADAKHLTYE